MCSRLHIYMAKLRRRRNSTSFFALIICNEGRGRAVDRIINVGRNVHQPRLKFVSTDKSVFSHQVIDSSLNVFDHTFFCL